MMDAESDIKTMKLYHDVERIYKELEEMGYSKMDKLKVEEVSKFDEYHYYGTKAVMECIKKLSINSSHEVLDFGSGIGGPARFLASQTNCKVLAMELQPDLDKTALDLTARCGLSERITHTCGNILYSDIGDASFDFLVNWLVILHIEDRKTLFNNCYRLLKPGGKIFSEDYFKLSDFESNIDKVLQEDVYIQHLPSRAQYIKQMEDAGFTNIEFEDLTESWRNFVGERLKAFVSTKDRNVRVLGQETYDALFHFFNKVNLLFNETKHVGGCRIIATK